MTVPVLPFLAAAQLLSTVFMTGLIWYVQVVHYPSFAYVRGGEYPAFQRWHERRTSWVVGPAMAVEAASAVGLAMSGWSRLPVAWLALGLALLAAIWISTVTLQVPQHRRLESGFDEAAHRRLVATNWIRTVAWSLRAGLALALLREALRVTATGGA